MIFCHRRTHLNNSPSEGLGENEVFYTLFFGPHKIITWRDWQKIESKPVILVKAYDTSKSASEIMDAMFITGYGHSTNRPGHHGTVVARTVGSNASCHSHSLENATHLAGTGVQVLIYMGQMQPASSSIRWSVDARCDSHTDFHLQQKIEYKSGFHGNDYKK